LRSAECGAGLGADLAEDYGGVLVIPAIYVVAYGERT